MSSEFSSYQAKTPRLMSECHQSLFFNTINKKSFLVTLAIPFRFMPPAISVSSVAHLPCLFLVKCQIPIFQNTLQYHTAADFSELIVLKHILQVLLILLPYIFRSHNPHPGANTGNPAKEL